MLGGLPPADWSRCGVHEARGPLSLLDVLTDLVERDEEHCAQLEALSARS